MAEKVLFQITHIKVIEVHGGEWCIEVDDYELYEFVQDFLWNNFQIAPDLVGWLTKNNIKFYRDYYRFHVNADDLIIALSQIDLQEVERIYKLNN